jgi:MFS transporter, ACS family, glucarate transporter
LWVAGRRIGERTHNLKLARRSVAIVGFLIAGASILPATLATSPAACVAYTCLALLGLELTVGVSWAVPLDIGGDYAGSVSAFMNMCGNLGGLVSTTLLAYLVRAYGWNMPFFLGAAACGVAAPLFANSALMLKRRADTSAHWRSTQESCLRSPCTRRTR